MRGDKNRGWRGIGRLRPPPWGSTPSSPGSRSTTAPWSSASPTLVLGVSSAFFGQALDAARTKLDDLHGSFYNDRGLLDERLGTVEQRLEHFDSLSASSPAITASPGPYAISGALISIRSN